MGERKLLAFLARSHHTMVVKRGGGKEYSYLQPDALISDFESRHTLLADGSIIVMNLCCDAGSACIPTVSTE